MEGKNIKLIRLHTSYAGILANSATRAEVAALGVCLLLYAPHSPFIGSSESVT